MPWEERAEGGKEINFELSNIIYPNYLFLIYLSVYCFPEN